MLSDLFDRLRPRISIFRYDIEPGLRWSIDDIDGDIWVFFCNHLEIFSEPILLTIQSVWWVEIDDLDSKIVCEREDLIALLFVQSSCRSSDTHDREITTGDE